METVMKVAERRVDRGWLTALALLGIGFFVACTDGQLSYTRGGELETSTESGLTLSVAGTGSDVEEATLRYVAQTMRQAALSQILDPFVVGGSLSKRAPIELAQEDCHVRLIRGETESELDFKLLSTEESGGLLHLNIRLGMTRDDFQSQDLIEVTCDGRALNVSNVGALGATVKWEGGYRDGILEGYFDPEIDLCRRMIKQLRVQRGIGQVNLALLTYIQCLAPQTSVYDLVEALLSSDSGTVVPPDPDQVEKTLDEFLYTFSAVPLRKQIEWTEHLKGVYSRNAIEEMFRKVERAYSGFHRCVIETGITGRSACLDQLAEQILELATETGIDLSLFDQAFRKAVDDADVELQQKKQAGKYPNAFNLMERKEVLGNNLFELEILKFNTVKQQEAAEADWAALFDRIRAATAEGTVTAPESMRSLFDGSGVVRAEVDELVNKWNVQSGGVPFNVVDSYCGSFSEDSTCEDIGAVAGVSVRSDWCVGAMQRLDSCLRVKEVCGLADVTGACDWTDSSVDFKTVAGVEPKGDLLLALQRFLGESATEFFGEEIDSSVLREKEWSSVTSESYITTARASLRKAIEREATLDSDGDGCPDMIESFKGWNPFSSGDCNPVTDVISESDQESFSQFLGTTTSESTPSKVKTTVVVAPQSSSTVCDPSQLKGWQVICTGAKDFATQFIDASETSVEISLIPDSDTPYTCAVTGQLKTGHRLDKACAGTTTQKVTGEGTTFTVAPIEPDSSVDRFGSFEGRKLSRFVDCDSSVAIGKNASCTVFGSGTVSKIEFAAMGGTKKEASFTQSGDDYTICVPNLGAMRKSVATVTFSDGSSIASNPFVVKSAVENPCYSPSQPPSPLPTLVLSAPATISKGTAYTITATSNNFVMPPGGSRTLTWHRADTDTTSSPLLNVDWSLTSLTHTIPIDAPPPAGTQITFTVTIKDSDGKTVRQATSSTVTVE